MTNPRPSRTLSARPPLPVPVVEAMPQPSSPASTPASPDAAATVRAAIDQERRAIDDAVNDIRARVDATIHEQEDRVDRWQSEQEARLDRALCQQRAWLEERLAELGAATEGAGGTALQAATRAITTAEATAARLHDQIASAAQQAERTAATLAEGLAHRSASMAAHAEDHAARATETLKHLGDQAERRIHALEQRVSRLLDRAAAIESICQRAERLAGIDPAATDFPAHEAPAPWPPAPAPGSLPDLIDRAHTVVNASKTLVRDLARQTWAGERAQQELEAVVQDAAASARAHRAQYEKVRDLVQTGVEAGSALETVLGQAIQEAQSTANRLEQARDVGGALRSALSEAREIGALLGSRLGALREYAAAAPAASKRAA